VGHKAQKECTSKAGVGLNLSNVKSLALFTEWNTRDANPCPGQGGGEDIGIGGGLRKTSQRSEKVGGWLQKKIHTKAAWASRRRTLPSPGSEQ